MQKNGIQKCNQNTLQMTNNNNKSSNQGLYQTTTVGAQKEKIESLMNQLVRVMDKLGYDVQITFKKRNDGQ